MSSRGDRQHRSPARGRQVKRPIFHIGPGILFALILAAIVGSSAIKSEMQRRQAARSGPPIVERQIVSSDIEKLGPVPEVSFLIDRRDKLGLSESQLRSLRKLQFAWQKFYFPKMKVANAAVRQAADYMSGAEKNRQTPTAQIQREAAPVVAISGEISAVRRQYWARATALLAPAQRLIAAREREADYAA